jgi:hypothetical protein
LVSASSCTCMMNVGTRTFFAYPIGDPSGYATPLPTMDRPPVSRVEKRGR